MHTNIDFRIKNLYYDYKELRYLGKSHDETINEFNFLDNKTLELLKQYVKVKNNEKTKIKTNG